MRAREGRPRRWIAPAALSGALLAGMVLGITLGAAGPSARRSEVAERGSSVMPFDLERTTHRFQPLPDGGVQTVLADGPGHLRQTKLIRLHLRQEAEAFRRGDFGDPASIHGEDMPGLADLRSGAGRFEVRYADVPGGARLRYVTDDPELVEALRRWFEAQLFDHGPHAERGT